ncbi:hypothetical protein EDD85DRAFT_937124 [Armillaria nabsnona]|nr:hypothetical protein EDD85DRAFT_937124 [Armillaria nabsnona]
MESATPPFIVPSASAANLSDFLSWTRAALVDDLPSPTSTPAVEAQKEVITRFELPESLEKSLTVARDDLLEDPMTQEFAPKLLAAYAGRFTSTTDVKELAHYGSHKANYRVSTKDETEIQQFAYNHDVTKEVSTEAGSDICYFLLAMFAIEYNSDSAAAFHQLLIDFAAILRHRQLLGFSFDYLLGMTGCHYTGANSFRLKFFLGALDGERGRVKSWDVGELDIIRPEELLQAYVWISNSISQFVAFANGWHFDPSAPRDLEKLAWRADGSEKGSRGQHRHYLSEVDVAEEWEEDESGRNMDVIVKPDGTLFKGSHGHFVDGRLDTAN